MITPLLLLLGVVLGLPLAYYFFDVFSQRRMRNKLIHSWGYPDALRRLDPEELRDAAYYEQALLQHSGNANRVDDITWNDLDMDSFFTSLDAATSIVGSEVLYTMLRDQGASLDTLMDRHQLSDAFQQDEDLRLQAQSALFYIGRSAYHGAWRYLFSASFQYPGLPWLYPILAVLPLLFLLLGALQPWFFFVAAAAFLVNIFVHFRSQATWQKEVTAIRHLGAVLKAAQKLNRIDHPRFAVRQKELDLQTKRLRAIRFWLPLFGNQAIGDMAIIMDYIKIFFMLDMLSLVAIVRIINRHNEAMRAIYEKVGEVDACLSIAQLAAREKGLCQPRFQERRALSATGLRHPLIRDAVTNDLDWENNILISGSNASGKSTFIKAVAVNLILAQTLFLCCADTLTTCRGQVMSAMAVRDNIAEGESYFVVEIKSLKRILDRAAQGMVFCFIDEILRGTNTIERIAASSAVLAHLAKQRGLCMAATHDIELTRLLAALYDNRHFSEVVDEAGLRFDYLLKPGPTRTRNAIRLLEQMGYPDPVISQAILRAAQFDHGGTWE